MKRLLPLILALATSLHAANTPINNGIFTGTLTLNRSSTTGFIPWANVSTGGVLSGISSITSLTSAGVTLTGGPLTVNLNAEPATGLGGFSGAVLSEFAAADATAGRIFLDSFGASDSVEFRASLGTNAAPMGITYGSPLGGLGFSGYNGSAYFTVNNRVISSNANVTKHAMMSA